MSCASLSFYTCLYYYPLKQIDCHVNISSKINKILAYLNASKLWISFAILIYHARNLPVSSTQSGLTVAAGPILILATSLYSADRNLARRLPSPSIS